MNYKNLLIELNSIASCCNDDPDKSDAIDYAIDCVRREANQNENSFGASWGLRDIKKQAEEDDVTLTKEQAREIANAIERTHDATIGINWEVISEHIRIWVDVQPST